MNRELYHPLSIGAIINCIIMAFSFKLPIFLFIFLTLVFVIFYLKSGNLLVKKVIIITLSVLIAAVGVYRAEFDKRSYYLPLVNSKCRVGDIEVLKDSAPIESGFLTYGKLVRVKNRQFTIKTDYPVCVYSKSEFVKGDLLSNQSIKTENGSVYSYYNGKDSVTKAKGVFKLRSSVLYHLKSRTQSPLLLALLTGNKSQLDRHNIEMFRKSGASHILALSGFHVSIVVLLMILISRIFFTGNAVYFISLAALITYLFIVGLTPSLIRSVIMFVVISYCKVRRVKLTLFMVLIYTYHIMILICPKDFYSLSFKLSFLALLGIITIGKEIYIIKVIRRLPKVLKASLSASIGATVLTSFICFPAFGVIYPVSILSSLLLTPVITLFIWFGIISLFIPALGSVIIIFETIIYKIVELFSYFPVIDESLIISPYVTLIFLFIPVILLVLKIHRRLDAGRFNIKVKL